MSRGNRLRTLRPDPLSLQARRSSLLLRFSPFLEWSMLNGLLLILSQAFLFDYLSNPICKSIPKHKCNLIPSVVLLFGCFYSVTCRLLLFYIKWVYVGMFQQLSIKHIIVIHTQSGGRRGLGNHTGVSSPDACHPSHWNRLPRAGDRHAVKPSTATGPAPCNEIPTC